MRLSLLLAGVFVIAVACGGNSEPGPSATTGSASSPPASTAAPKETSAATTAPAKTGGASSPEACALITTDEVGRIMGAAGVRTELLAGDPSYCTYRDGAGSIVAATTYMRSGAATAFQALSSGSQPVSGLGERAQWEPNSATLQILKGGTVLAITAGDGRMAAPQRQDLAKQLGAVGSAKQ